MSIRLMSIVFLSKLPIAEKMILLAMADYASDTGDSIFPSIETLSNKCSLSERSIQRSIQSLIEQEYLELQKQGGGRNYTNLYRIRVDKLKDDTMTPIRKKGVIMTEKGVTLSEKGVTMTPDPLLTINESSLTGISYEACDEDGIEVAEKKKRAKSKSPAPEKFDIANALAEVTGMSLAANKSRIFAEAGELSKDARVSGALIRQEFGMGGAWYLYDWRGKLGQKPKLQDIRANIFTYGEVRQLQQQKVITGSVKDRAK